jgi:lipoprotein-releasing system permease protein
MHINILSCPLFIARRVFFHKSAEGEKTMPRAARIAVAGIALGLAVMMLTVAIFTGFRREVRNKVIGFGSHIQVTQLESNASFESAPIAVTPALLDSLREVVGVRHVSVFANKAGILKTATDFEGIIIKGVGTDYDWSFFRSNLKEGALPAMDTEKPSSEVLLPRYLANRTGLQTGDNFTAYFVQDDVRARRFSVSGIYETGFPDYDRLFVLGDIRQLQRVSGWEADCVGGVELLVENYDELDWVTEEVYFQMAAKQDRMGSTYYTRSIRDINPQIFGWLEMLDINVAVILVLMLAVAGFTMISGLLILILSRTNMIGILKALGMDNRGVRRVFLHLSVFLIGKGLLWGNVIGLALCLIQKYGKVVPLNPDIYYLDAVPIQMSGVVLLLLNIGTLLVSLLMLLGPSWAVSKVTPISAIRFE